LFTDFKGFTTIAKDMTPTELVAELNEFFVAFDDIIEKNGLEKIKTIGDAYMCAGGIPTTNKTHPVDIVRAGLQIQEFMNHHSVKRVEKGLQPWGLRVGIHTGPVTAGVVGRKKYAYDIWGSAVNIASRMESSGDVGKVNISAATYDLVKDVFPCSHRGKISAKNVGEIDMYFVESEELIAV
jgi:class 3 adenylate cyclase